MKALDLVRGMIEGRGDSVAEIKMVHGGKHAIVYTDSGMIYYVLFKREMFGSFGDIFNRKGIGESINAEALDLAMDRGAMLVLVAYPDGKVYSLTPDEWSRSPYIRDTEDGERTISVPINWMRRWK